MTIIAITGTLGAGKGTVVDYLKEKGFTHYSVRNYLEKEMARRGLPSNRDNMRFVANDLRKNHFPGYIIGELLKEAQSDGELAVIESIRSFGEVDLLRKEAPHALLWAIDADIKVRYERIVKRGSSTDNISFEKFASDEKREMDATAAWDMNITSCMAAADATICNDDTVEELQKNIEKALAKELATA